MMSDENDPEFGEALFVEADMMPDDEDVALAIDNASRMLLGLIAAGVPRNLRVDTVTAMWATIEHSMPPEMKVRANVLLGKLREKLEESDARRGIVREHTH